MSLSNRIFSLNGLSRQRVVQKLDAQQSAEIESSLPLSFQLLRKKKSTGGVVVTKATTFSTLLLALFESRLLLLLLLSKRKSIE